jgi:hypothetical protein
VLFSSFVLPDSFSTVPRTTCPVFMFCAPRLVFDGTEGDRFRFARPDSFSAVSRESGPVFVFCAPGHFFGGAECAESHFHVLRTQTHFQRFRRRPIPFSCFSDPGHVFGSAEVVGSCFLVLRSQTLFRRNRVRWVLFSCFARRNSFSPESRASTPIFMFLRSWTHFRLYRGRRVSFSSFAHPDTFSEVSRAPGPIFIFCAPKAIFGDTEGVGSRFHILRARTHFLQNRGRPIPFSGFPLLDMFTAVQRASGPVFMFCTPGLIFVGAECVGSRFHILRSRTRFRRYRGRHVPF